MAMRAWRAMTDVVALCVVVAAYVVVGPNDLTS
jgi:hypothetical protein